MDRLDDFQVAVIPHVAAAYRLAYQIVEDENEAQDIVQDAYVMPVPLAQAATG